MLVELKGVTRKYRVREGFFARNSGTICALDNVSLSISENEIVGLVGESGCGKSTLARIMLGLERPDSGSVLFDGLDTISMNRKENMRFRKRSQMVFQDPYSSLNPRRTVYNALKEPMLIHGVCGRSEMRDAVESLLEVVGLDSAAADRYPHEFSGGQRQRIGIARALATDPDLLVADEPTSALDVSIQAQIINLLLDLQEQRRLSMLFISHDLPVVSFVSKRVAVMYRGQVMEILPADRFKYNTDMSSFHPYTRFLLDSIPLPDPGRVRRLASERQKRVQDEYFGHSSKGCSFAPRCMMAEEICFNVRPEPVLKGDVHMVACHF